MTPEITFLRFIDGTKCGNNDDFVPNDDDDDDGCYMGSYNDISFTFADVAVGSYCWEKKSFVTH
jgi:hypothetical protein